MRSLYKKLFLGFFCCLCLIAVSGQSISTIPANGLLPDTFLNRYFAGEGVKLHNCKFNWSSSAINGSQVGTFANTNPQFPFSSGVILTTGNISVAQGPNSSGSESSTTGVNQAAVDPDLQPLVASGQPLDNASVLEFNFYSGRNEYSNIVSFNYIFGSEEYPEYVCSSFNDVFGFFLYGPDPFGAPGVNVTKNMAIIPGSGGLPVSINALNNGTVGANGSASNCVSLDYSQFYRSNSGGAIEYDGFTTTLIADASLCACSEYRMKISIANVSDGSYDSGVFLEKGSFKLPKEVTITDSITTMGLDTLIKNCHGADIDIHYGEPLESSMKIVYYCNGGTANENDFYVLRFRTNNLIDTLHHGDTIYFPEGDTLIQLKIDIKESAQFAANQSKQAQLVFKSILCPNFRYLDGRVEERAQYDTITYVMVDNKRFTLISEDRNKDSIFFCDRCTHIEVPIIGGTEPLIYKWTPATGLNTSNARETDCNITENTTFQIIVSDRWGCMTDTCYHTALITSTPVLAGHFHITPSEICVPEEVTFKSTATPASTHRWTISSANMPDTTFYGANSSFTFTEPGRYSILYKAYEALACADSVFLSNYINAGKQPTALFNFEPAEAEVGQEVVFTNQSEGQNVHYSWSFGDGSNSNEENPTHVYNNENSDNYNVILTVADDANCQDMYMAPVPVVDNHVLFVPNTFTPNKDGLNDVFLPVVACVAKYYIMIYDRNGGLVFYSDNPEIGWDGSSNGIECPSGIYTYYINYVRYNNLKQELIKTGSINLIR
jgi:gliding motility-associated-like protein